MQTWLTTWLNILQVRKFAAIDKHPGKIRDGGRGGGGGGGAAEQMATEFSSD